MLVLFSGCTTPADEDEEHLEDSDTELPCDDDMTPVLQVRATFV